MRKYGYVVVEGPHDVEFVYPSLRIPRVNAVQKFLVSLLKLE